MFATVDSSLLVFSLLASFANPIKFIYLIALLSKFHSVFVAICNNGENLVSTNSRDAGDADFAIAKSLMQPLMEKGAAKQRFKNLGRNIGEVFRSDSAHLLPLLLAIYVVFAFAVMEGNVCEDLFLFLLTCSLLLLYSLRDRDSFLSYVLAGLLDGMIVGFLFFVKFNLIAFPGACALAMAYLGWRRRQFGRLSLGVEGLIKVYERV